VANGKITTTLTAQEFRKYKIFCKKLMLERGRGGGKRERSKVFQGSQKYFTCYFGGGGYYICFTTNPFPRHRRFVCVVLPEGTYERN